MPEYSDVVTGWYGKMPSLGDFSQRSLPPYFVRAWDDWLSEGLLASQQALGGAWLEVYLTSPVWNFYLMPGVIGEPMWAGVLLPSVDKAGRYFPLTLASEIPALGLVPSFEQAATWFAQLETVAIETLEQRLNPEQLANRLAEVPFQLPIDPMPEVTDCLATSLMTASMCRLTLPDLGDVPGLLNSTILKLWLKQAAGMSMWWTKPRPDSSSSLFCQKGLPSSEGFVALLDPEHLEARVLSQQAWHEI